MPYSGNYQKKNYCTAIGNKCAGFLCSNYRFGNCKGVLWSAVDRDGNIIATLSPSSFEDEDVSNIIMRTIEEIHKSEYLTKDEIIEVLKKKYGIELSKRMLKYYGTEGLIEPGIVTKIPGIKGSVSIYKENIPGIINFYNILKKRHKFTLKKIIKLSNILNFKDKEKLELYWEHYESHRVRNKGEKKNQGTYFDKNILEITEFEMFSILRAFFELGRIDSVNDSLSIVDVTIDKGKSGEFEIIVKFFENPEKKVIFNKSGVKVA